jgi:two-component system, OmpR family, phosphate regulon sensor histidine kinase PhoR
VRQGGQGGGDLERRAQRRSRVTPLRIVLVYAGAGIAWILLSDSAIAVLVGDPARAARVGAAKGIAYVCFTAVLLLYFIRRHEHERLRQDEEVRAVLAGMVDAVLVVDDRGDVVGVNRAAVELFHAASERDLLVAVDELMTRIAARKLDGTAVPRERTAPRRALAGEVVTAVEGRIRALDGKEQVVSVTAAPILAHPGERPRLAVAVLRDIGEQERFEEMREEFFATAAHELRTPLAVVKAYAQLMRKRGQGDAPGLDTIVRQIDRLTRLVQQLLEVSRFRAGGAELRADRFDLAAALAETADALRPAADGHRIVVSASAPAVVVADRERIVRVISSLLENAVRFSPDGGDVEAGLERRGPDAVVSVRDHGVGIPHERQARVFERFYRAHAGTAHDYGGLGVGLDMSREIVARHGGRIWFESAPGQGSTFWFSLPLAEGRA